MSGKRTFRSVEILKDHTGEIAKVRSLGITEYAIITYVVRVHEGQPRDHALDALLQGRSLSSEQRSFVGDVLSRLFPD